MGTSDHYKAIVIGSGQGGMPLCLRDGVFAHPTLADSLDNLFTHFDT